MAGKSKFQISRSLEDRLRSFASGSSDRDGDELTNAYILGFNYSNVTNYVGLTRDYQLHSSGLQVVGLAFFDKHDEAPPKDQVINLLQPVRDYYLSPDTGIGKHSKTDKHEDLALIYYFDASESEESRKLKKEIFDLNSDCYLEEQPKFSLLDDSKMYNHSAIVRLTASFKLAILDETGTKVVSNDKIESAIDEAKKLLGSDSKKLMLHLQKSNFSTKSPLDLKNSLESLYNSLDVPEEVNQMADYLPQMTKKEKEKQVEKWRNKVKDQRASLEFKLEHEDLDSVAGLPKEYYTLTFSEYLYLHVQDSISKSMKLILLVLRQKLSLLKQTLLNRMDRAIEADEFKSCCFKPATVNHFVQAIYPISKEPNYKELTDLRRQIHDAYLLPLDRPVVRYAQRVVSTNPSENTDSMSGYLCNVHTSISDKSGVKGGIRNIVDGTYTYHHYLQNKTQDSGWGCAYRSLQTIVSWFKHQGYIYSPDVALRAPKGVAKAGDSKMAELRALLAKEGRVPNHEEIQNVLVDLGDKQPSFIKSQKWIGSQEVCYVLNHLYDIDSKFISVSSGDELVYKARDLGQHFAIQSTPVMIGGGVLAHTIIGLDFNNTNGDISYLILDPHYTGGEDLGVITKKGWCGWKKNSFWEKNSFYNLCLPQRPIEF